jgi:3-isopropylmalate/(R)-2-methylmalate dehydratase small subunit
MKKKVDGQVHKLGHNVDIDQLCLGKIVTEESQSISLSLGDNLNEFSLMIRKGDIILAGKCFGQGFSIDRAAKALKSAGVGCVIASSYSRAFYRTSISQGLALVENDEAYGKIAGGETVAIDFERNEIACKKGIISFQPWPEAIIKIIQSGGIIAHSRKLLGK